MTREIPRILIVALALAAAGLFIWSQTNETRGEALERCRRSAGPHVRYVDVERTARGWACLYGAGSP